MIDNLAQFEQTLPICGFYPDALPAFQIQGAHDKPASHSEVDVNGNGPPINDGSGLASLVGIWTMNGSSPDVLSDEDCNSCNRFV